MKAIASTTPRISTPSKFCRAKLGTTPTRCYARPNYVGHVSYAHHYLYAYVRYVLGPLAQLGRAPPRHGGGRWFDPNTAHPRQANGITKSPTGLNARHCRDDHHSNYAGHASDDYPRGPAPAWYTKRLQCHDDAHDTDEIAGLAHSVERQASNLKVASSSLATRFPSTDDTHTADELLPPQMRYPELRGLRA